MREFSKGVAFFSALLFACHPLQTEAVTYIWQRVTSLTAMLYVLSLVAYIQWRLLRYQTHAPESHRFSSMKSVSYYLVSFIAAVLAMKTKQTAFTLPVTLALYEFMFFNGKKTKRIFSLIPLFLTMSIIPLTLIDIGKPWGDVIGDVGEVTRDLTEMSRLDYLFTQFRVMVTYIRLILLPVNQNLDYDYPLYRSFFNPEVFLSFMFLITIAGTGVYILYRFRNSVPENRLTSFGIFWFFITLSVESSVIPIKELIFEYRMYLPSVGVFLALTTAIFMVIDRRKVYARVITAMLAVIIIALTGATYARNSVWKDEMSLWQDVVNKSPDKARPKARPLNNLGNCYYLKGRYFKAREYYLKSIQSDPYHLPAYENMIKTAKILGLKSEEKLYLRKYHEVYKHP
jgi:hypothetical protein